ncbi:iron ABC transporter permease [Bacillus sp. DX4.1]|uniref:FecCD family ABC transporter permease n=1 Tax=Bacillus sp. DX4.1 TaxID=3055867 RepID=UPI0025A02CD1|nr:iron ABC transporter permease [Bacillus sp. DX4.1]MDM5189445.1 iron ABC transporter permease [Bacillus sp. DX4.1]
MKKIVGSLFLILVLLVVSSIAVGENFISPWKVVQTLFGVGNEMDTLVIWSLRLPRIILALLVGVALAISGALLQSIVRNPLASPDVIGVTNGAGLAVITFLYIFSTNGQSQSLTVSIQWLPLAAFIGATVVGLVVYLLSSKNGRVSTFTLVLIGIGMAMLSQSITTLMMMKSAIHQAAQANLFITGTVSRATWEQIAVLAPILLVLLIAIWMNVRHVNVQQLHEDTAMSLGSSVQKQRFFLLLLSTALAGSAVAFAGTIGFVGLVAPHIARRLVGSMFDSMVVVSALVGAIIVVAADLIGRTLFTPLDISAGVFTALIGAPYFIYILFKTKG